MTRAHALLLILVLAGCRDWKSRVVPGRAVTEPKQTLVEAKPTLLEFAGTKAMLTAKAHYSTTAWVVALDRDFDDPFANVMALDFSLAWGPMGNPDVLHDISFHLAKRYVSLRWSKGLPIDQRAVMEHVSNHHLIASSEDVAKALAKVRVGDLVELEGSLVDVEVNGQKMRTSLSRGDIGNGACEILYVERADRISF